MARKGENIYKRKDGRWEGRYIKGKSVGNKVRYGYVYAHTYREVKDKLAGAMNNIQAQDKKEEETRILFQRASEEWQESIRPKVKESTAVKYKNLLNSYLLPAFGQVALQDITYENIEIYCNRMLLTGGQKKCGLSPKTVSDTLSLMHNILRYASDKGYVILCDRKPVSVKLNPHKIRVLSRSEQEKLCKYLYHDLNAKNMGILFCLFTGLRVGELCALKWDDISFSEKIVYVRKTMQRLQIDGNPQKRTEVVISTPKSSCSIRAIPLPEELICLLYDFKANRRGFFLTGAEERFLEPRTMQKHFQKVLLESGLEPVNYHVLRHTFATRCIEVGFDVKSLSEILGHANVNITMNRYVHPSMDLKRENMQRLSPLFAVK